MKKFKAMFAANAAVMALSAVSVPMSAFASEELVAHDTEQVYKYDGTNTTGTWQPITNNDMQLTPNPNTKVNVDFSINPTYTVTIPADVHFADKDREKAAQVKVENVFLAPKNAVEVTVKSEHQYQMWLDGSDDEFFIPYSLGRVLQGDGQEGSRIEPINELVVVVPTGSQDEKGSETVNLQYKIGEVEVEDPDNPGQTILKPYDVKRAGSYSDLLTFTIKVVELN